MKAIIKTAIIKTAIIKKVIILMPLLVLGLHAVTPAQITGKWSALTQSRDSAGVSTVEKEYMFLNPDNTFSITLFVSVSKDDAYVKDLEIVAKGIWKVQDNTLVSVIKEVNVPEAREVHLISQQSLENLAANFKRRFENNPIHINTIQSFDTQSMKIINHAKKVTTYRR